MQLLTTKLYIPPPRSDAVPRRRLIEQLSLRRKLTLLSAPAGFGKTTLLSEWIASQQQPTAWLSLDENDSDPIRFLSYLIAALQTISPHIGEGLLESLESPQPPPIELILTSLINQLSAASGTMLVVLDDYHVLESKAVDDALAFLLEHLPPRIHLVIATREDPQLPLARLRARSQLTEVRIADLRFTLDEAAAFLNQVMGLQLGANDIAALESRTEGWIAGLQLAALSMQGQQDTSSFIRSFSGSHHFVLDYLVEEVLHQQPLERQIFLLRTAILDRMCGSLCDAVLGVSNPTSQQMLEDIEHANLFIIPLDNERRWYRYHHLFAELLRQKLQQRTSTIPGEPRIAELHSRASDWYEAHGRGLEAFRHATTANDLDRAERLLESRSMQLHTHSSVNTILGWLGSLPPAVFSERPALWVRYGATLLVAGHTSGVEQKLDAAEKAFGTTEPNQRTRRLLGHIAAARATLALTRYNIAEMAHQSRRALEYLPASDLPFRATANWTLAYAYYWQGDRASSMRAFQESVALSQAANDVFSTILAILGLGQVYEIDNLLHRAADAFREVLQLAGEQPQQIVGEAHLGLARIAYEWNDLEAAERYGQTSLQLARQYESIIDRFIVGEVFLARLKLAHGDVDAAAAQIIQTEQFARQNEFVLRLPEIAAMQVLVLLRQGKTNAAAQLANTYHLPLSLARVQLAQNNSAAAFATLEPLRQQAAAHHWHDEWVRAVVLQAVGQHLLGHTAAAVDLLNEALTHTEANHFVRTYLDEGAPMKQLLQEAIARGNTSEYARSVLAAFATRATKQIAQPIVEPLSERELEVLHHIATGRTDQEIADHLYLSLYTVKVHARNIYGKLGVNKRTQAVAKARELGLLRDL